MKMDDFNFEIIVGTYEEYLLGYKVKRSAKNEDDVTLSQTFATRDHTASVRCVDASKNYLVSGGADEKIFVYDMVKRNVVQILMHHEATVNTLKFSGDGGHLFSGGGDGQIAISRTGSWTKDKVFQHAHKGKSVNTISIHPSGKLALSLGGDMTLRTWNLVKGRQAYATNLNAKDSLGKIIESVEFSEGGKYFSLTGAKVVEIYDVESAKIIKTEKCEAKPNCVCWINNDDLFVGLDNGDILFITLTGSGKSKTVKASDKRIKGISFLNEYLVTISSSFELVLWKLHESTCLEKICSTNIGCRPTCVTIVEFSVPDKVENKQSEVAESKTVGESATGKRKKPPVSVVEVEIENDDEVVEDEKQVTISKSTPGKKSKKKKKVIQQAMEVEKPAEEEVISPKKRFKQIESPIDVDAKTKSGKKSQNGGSIEQKKMSNSLVFKNKAKKLKFKKDMNQTMPSSVEQVKKHKKNKRHST